MIILRIINQIIYKLVNSMQHYISDKNTHTY